MSLKFNGNDCSVLWNGTNTTGIYNGEQVWGNNGWIRVNLNSQWKEYDVSQNTELSSYRCFYSDSNYHIPTSSATMFLVPLKDQTLNFKYCSVAESNYDYFVFIDNTTSAFNTSGKQSTNSATLADYRTTAYDLNKTHSYTCLYRKDGSKDTSFDRAYVLIDKKDIKEVLE